MIVNTDLQQFKVKKIGVIGPGIVGMPMAALLADANIRIGSETPAEIVVIQRNSQNSGWKVDAINSGKSVIGGIEPELDEIVERTVKNGTLRASSDYSELTDADVVLVCVQTDKKEMEPDYGPLFGALDHLADALTKKPKENIPLIIFESTLAPSTMTTMIKDHFAKYNLIEGKDILLGNSPNRVMPGRLVERIRISDKLIGGLDIVTTERIKRLYSYIVTEGKLFTTNSITAEIVKTLENAYRDIRIAFSSEIVNLCDHENIDFYKVREKVNQKLNQTDLSSYNPNVVPAGGMLIPTIGVGGHCLPKDGILLWWRKFEKREDSNNSLIMLSREINNNSPLKAIQFAEESFGSLKGKKVALLGAAYRFNSEDTRNSPTLTLANELLSHGCNISIHDPYVKSSDQNLIKYKLLSYFTSDIEASLKEAEYLIFCTAHQIYFTEFEKITSLASKAVGVFDGCNIFPKDKFNKSQIKYTGIGKGDSEPDEKLIKFVFDSFKIVEIGFANEINNLVEFFNNQYAENNFDLIEFNKVQELAVTCGTGCELVNPEKINTIPEFDGFKSKLVEIAYNSYMHNSSGISNLDYLSKDSI